MSEQAPAESKLQARTATEKAAFDVRRATFGLRVFVRRALERALGTGLPPRAPPRRPRPETPKQPGVPPEIIAPVALNYHWALEPLVYGSATSPGTPAAKEDKGNQDFACHGEVTAPNGERWAVAGVADGVSDSPWSNRGSRHALAAFVETFDRALSEPWFPRSPEQLSASDWRERFAAALIADFHARIGPDRDLLWDGKFIEPTFGADGFLKHVLSGKRERSLEWHQTTLLAAAVGPWGGFAVLAGDGHAIVRAEGADGRLRIVHRLIDTTDDRGNPPMLLTAQTKADEVAKVIFPFAAGDAAAISVLLATDGVSDSSKAALEKALAGVYKCDLPDAVSPLDRAELRSTKDCNDVLSVLGNLRVPQVVDDNMSLAFVRWERSAS